MTKKVTTPEVTEQTTAESTQQLSDIDVATERRLVALYTLQLVDSEIDKIKIIRGELPRPSRTSKTRLPVYKPASAISRKTSPSRMQTSPSATTTSPTIRP